MFSFGDTSSNLFGSSSTGSTFSFGGFGASTPASTTSTFAAAPAAPVQGSTKFKDLPEAWQTKFTEFEQFIRKQNQQRDEIAEHLKTTTQRGRLNVEGLIQEAAALTAAVDREAVSMQTFGEDVRNELKSTEIAARHLAKLQSASGAALPENIYLPSPYHWSKVDQFVLRMEQLKSQIDELSEVLTYSEQQAAVSNPKLLPLLLKQQHEALLYATTRTMNVHSRADQLRDNYVAWRGAEARELLLQTRKDLELPALPDPSVLQTTLAPTTLSTAASAVSTPATTGASSSSLFSLGTTSFSTDSGFSFGSSSTGTGFSFGSTTATDSSASFSFNPPTFSLTSSSLVSTPAASTSSSTSRSSSSSGGSRRSTSSSRRRY